MNISLAPKLRAKSTLVNISLLVGSPKLAPSHLEAHLQGKKWEQHDSGSDQGPHNLCKDLRV